MGEGMQDNKLSGIFLRGRNACQMVIVQGTAASSNPTGDHNKYV
jgi:hypothetical protein